MILLPFFNLQIMWDISGTRYREDCGILFTYGGKTQCGYVEDKWLFSLRIESHLTKHQSWNMEPFWRDTRSCKVKKEAEQGLKTFRFKDEKVQMIMKLSWKIIGNSYICMFPPVLPETWRVS